jgi:hypothetical protein
MNWITIENRNTWLDEIKTFHPDSTAYITQWRQFKKNAIEGIWRTDFGKYRYMTGPCYFYINFCKILDVNEETKSRRSIKPMLRDLEWEMSYLLLEARGFSGWREDEEYTSDLRVKEIEKDSLKLKKYKRLPKDCYKENGELKKFIEPRENIRKLHDTPKGPPLYYNQASNAMIFGARGGGKSYFIGIGNVLHEIIFDGAKYYTEEIIKKPHEVHCNIGSWESNKSSELCEKIELCMNTFATDEDLGVWGDESSDDYTPMPFYKSMSGSLAPNTKWVHSYEKKVNGKWLKFGSKSKVVHTNYKDNPTAAAGGRYSIMVVEESGLHPSLTLTHNSNIGCTQRDALKFGTLVYIGTSGDIEKVRESRKMFMDPEAYDIVAYDDDYENSGKIGFFVPAYYTAVEFKDDNGNTDVEAALAYYKERRAKALASKDAANYEGELMNYPIKPSEMFLTKKGNILPIGELEAQRANVIMDRNRKLYYTVGELIFDSKAPRGIRFKADLDCKLKPIMEYPTPKNQDVEGALIVYEPPIEELVNGKVVVPNIYILGVDPVDADTQGVGLSLTSIHVLKAPRDIQRWGGNELVASFIGRPYMGRDYSNEIMEKLAMWYGGHDRMISFERGGNVKEYFQKKSKLNLLMTQPKTILSYKSGETSKVLLYGTPLKSFEQKYEAIAYLRDWLLEEYATKDDGTIVRNLNLIRDTRLLEEMIAFDFEGNFDSTLAFAECIIGLKEKYNTLRDQAITTNKQDNILTFLNRNMADRYKQPTLNY